MSTPFRLIVPASIHEAMLAQALAEAPNECCGLLAGVINAGVGVVLKGYPLTNALASPTRYESDPHAMFLAVRDMREQGTEVLAVYHSHPTSPPIPSRTDLERNYSEEVVNLIVSLTTSPPSVRGWWLTARDYREASWEIEAEHGIMDTDKVKQSSLVGHIAEVTMTPLSTIAHGRSGDKGNHANVAILAYTRAGFDWLRQWLTTERVHDHFRPLGPSRIERFEASNLLGLNFVLYDVLAGGASRSLRSDTQGKTLALSLLQMLIPTPADLDNMRRPTEKNPS